MVALRPSRAVAERLLLRTRLASLNTPARSLLLSRQCGGARFYSSDDAPPPPLLQKLKTDLKTAMRAKDASRLTAIRSVLSAVLNASKTPSPITTDAQLVSLLKRTQRSSNDAIAEFAAAGRQDLVEKEQEQVRVWEEYVAASGVQVLNDENEIRAIVQNFVATLEKLTKGRAKMGETMKLIMSPDGPFEGKNVEKALLAKIVKEVIAC
ncbi:hypothetical protein AAE478_001837 [Parahypoxylon ruwenzoriense]